MKHLRNKYSKNFLLILLIVVFAVILYFMLFMHSSVVVEVDPERSVVTIDNAPVKIFDGKAEKKSHSRPA